MRSAFLFHCLGMTVSGLTGRLSADPQTRTLRPPRAKHKIIKIKKGCDACDGDAEFGDVNFRLCCLSLAVRAFPRSYANRPVLYLAVPLPLLILPTTCPPSLPRPFFLSHSAVSTRRTVLYLSLTPIPHAWLTPASIMASAKSPGIAQESSSSTPVLSTNAQNGAWLLKATKWRQEHQYLLQAVKTQEEDIDRVNTKSQKALDTVMERILKSEERIRALEIEADELRKQHAKSQSELAATRNDMKLIREKMENSIAGEFLHLRCEIGLTCCSRENCGTRSKEGISFRPHPSSTASSQEDIFHFTCRNTARDSTSSTACLCSSV